MTLLCNTVGTNVYMLHSYTQYSMTTRTGFAFSKNTDL